MADAVIAEDLVKSFGDVHALGGVSFAVPEGTVLGLLGPNGAGKTTTVRILTTLLTPDAGRGIVAGADVVREAATVRTRIGVAGQYAAVDEYLTGFENLDMVGRLYHLGAAASAVRARELLAQFHLEDAADRVAKTYSGGMRRRLDLAGALVARPPVIFLDEPTTGLDPRARGDMWDVIRDLVSTGTTVVLTTQYLEEAEQLADDIVVIDQGRVIAHGTADDLKSQVGGERLQVTVSTPGELPTTRVVLQEIGDGDVETDDHTRTSTVAVGDGTASLVDAVRRLGEAGVTIQDIGIRRPTLDDAFLALTGHRVGGDDSTAEGDE